ncbi:MAG: uroporphyrinogen decarboxylase family protein [Eubacteriales bacterium]
MNKFDERLQIFNEAAGIKRVKRIPFVANIFNWVAYDSPYKLTELLNDPKKITESFLLLEEKYQFDALFFSSLPTNYIRITDPLGGATGHVIDDETNSVQVKDISFMNYDELEEFADNPIVFSWTKLMLRKFPLLNSEGAIAKLKQSMLNMLEYFQADDLTIKILKEKYQVPNFITPGAIMSSAILPIEQLYTTYRGIKNTAIDMRKDPIKYKEILIKLEKYYVDPYLKAVGASEYGSTPDAILDTSIALLSHNMMNVKQFEMFLWPHLKMMIDAAAAKGKVIIIYAEGEIMRFIDYFQEIPKGTVILYSENDNIFELKKKLPNICLFGGMPCYMLGRSSKETCVDYAKKLIDELGRDGGYVFSQDKMISFASDCKPENLKAVSELVLTYGVN